MKKFNTLFLASLIFTQTCVKADFTDYCKSQWGYVKQTLLEPHFYGAYAVTALVGLFSTLYTSHMVQNGIGIAAGPKTVQFVKNTLLKAGFSPSKVDKLRIRTAEGKGFFSFHNMIFVPFTDEQLEKAFIYHKTQDDAEGKKLSNIEVRSFMAKCNERRGILFVDEETAQIVLQFFGYPITKKAIPFWRGILVHEMSHVANYDSVVAGSLAVGVAPFLYSFFVTRAYLRPDSLGYSVLYGLLTNVQLGSIIYFLISHFSSLPFRKYQEYRSDQEIIKRIKDSKVLESVAEGFSAHAKIQDINSFMKKLFTELLDEHPNSETRANYFKRAAERLKKNAVVAAA